jgi:CheY-like chemotaxis protein
VQATCSKCSHKVVVDDAKAPDRAFTVKCPKCQTPVKFAAKTAAAAPAASAPAPIPEAAPAPGSGSSADAEIRAGMMAQLRREMGLAAGAEAASMQALVALPDPAQAAAISQTLARQGFAVEAFDDGQEAARLLEQGVYSVVVTARTTAVAKGETLQQRVARLNPEGRRRIFLVLVGDEFKTGDGTQAFAAMADLVLSGRDAAQADTPLRSTMSERARLYQMFSDARRRFETSAS